MPQLRQAVSPDRTCWRSVTLLRCDMPEAGAQRRVNNVKAPAAPVARVATMPEPELSATWRDLSASLARDDPELHRRPPPTGIEAIDAASLKDCQMRSPQSPRNRPASAVWKPGDSTRQPRRGRSAARERKPQALDCHSPDLKAGRLRDPKQLGAIVRESYRNDLLS
jgi:hypothetical protein